MRTYIFMHIFCTTDKLLVFLMNTLHSQRVIMYLSPSPSIVNHYKVFPIGPLNMGSLCNEALHSGSLKKNITTLADGTSVI